MKEDYREEVKLDTLFNKLHKIETENKNLNRLLTEIQHRKPESESLSRTMNKRRGPMLGFIESILGPVVGVLTSENGEEYSGIRAIRKLGRIWGKQTHIVKAEIDEIHKELYTRTNEIHQMQSILEKTKKNMQNQEKSINGGKKSAPNPNN